jgi:hypothetical protein
LKASNGTPAFAGETNIRKAWFFVVIPAEAGIQDDLKKMKSIQSTEWKRPNGARTAGGMMLLESRISRYLTRIMQVLTAASPAPCAT